MHLVGSEWHTAARQSRMRLAHLRHPEVAYPDGTDLVGLLEIREDIHSGGNRYLVAIGPMNLIQIDPRQPHAFETAAQSLGNGLRPAAPRDRGIFRRNDQLATASPRKGA